MDCFIHFYSKLLSKLQKVPLTRFARFPLCKGGIKGDFSLVIYNKLNLIYSRINQLIKLRKIALLIVCNY